MEGGNSLSRKRFQFVIILFRLAGIPLMMKKSSNIQFVYSAVIVFSVLTTTPALFMKAVDERHDLKLAIKSFRIFLMALCHFWAFCLIRFRRKSLEKVLFLTDSFTWDDLPTRDTDTGYLTMAGMIPRVTVIFKSCIYFLSAYQSIYSAVRITINHELVFVAWYPFNPYASPYFQLVNITQVLFSAFGVYIVFTFPMTYITLVLIACSQLEKLRANLLKIGKDRFALLSEKDMNSRDSGEKKQNHEVFQNIQSQLNQCIRHHQKIIELMEEIEKTFNIALCGHFFIIFCILCFNAFYAVVCLGEISELLQTCVAHSIFLICLLEFCWFGNQLTEEAERVKDAAFGCNWIETPDSFQKCILFIIATANKEFNLTAGKFVPVCNKTLMTIMNQTLTFFMFLLEVKKRLEEPSK